MVRHAPFAALLLFTIIACDACGSVPVLHFAEDDAGPIDGGGDTGGPCVRTGSEICDDGIDNDCDGKTDCADESCQQRYTCVDAAPADWQLTGLVEGIRPGCPNGFGDSKDVRTVSGTTGACACDCGGAATCSPSGIVTGIDNDSGCNATTQTFTLTSDCDRLNGNGITVSTNAFVKATAGTAGACKATATGTPVPTREGRMCAVPKAGGGCKAGQVCAPRPSNGYAMCVTKPGSAVCPDAFPSARHAGTNATDTRSCSTCTCTTAPCAGEVKLYDNKDCDNSPKLTLKATALPGSCVQGTNGSFQARGYTSTATGGCVVATAGQATGTLTLANEATVCCK